MTLIEQLLALPRAQRMRELGTLTPEQQVCLIHALSRLLVEQFAAQLLVRQHQQQVRKRW